jgi:hypothetical protein
MQGERNGWMSLEESVLFCSEEEEEDILEDVKELVKEVRAYVDKPGIRTLHSQAQEKEQYFVV